MKIIIYIHPTCNSHFPIKLWNILFLKHSLKNFYIFSLTFTFSLTLASIVQVFFSLSLCPNFPKKHRNKHKGLKLYSISCRSFVLFLRGKIILLRFMLWIISIKDLGIKPGGCHGNCMMESRRQSDRQYLQWIVKENLTDIIVLWCCIRYPPIANIPFP